MPASLLPCLVCLKKLCETHQTLQQGRQALVSTGQRSLAAQPSRASTFAASRSRCSSGARAAGRQRSVRGCRGGSRSSSATCQSPAGRAGHANQIGRNTQFTPASPSRHFPESVRGKYRHGSARNRCRTRQFCRPLHSAPFQFRRLHFHFAAFRRPQTVETVTETVAPE